MRSLIDYIAVDERMKREIMGAKIERGMFSGSNHFAMLTKVRMRTK